ncbi:hypothetical protein UY3_07811 [Chelonia mydas]|uniref:Myb/SANT-like DNA-binding domain-containing protein n=1 Tax=Chelonia mydas TaxID=8469 RepID=M7BSC5_CHEMY|nr:hypothetical protein UY3_07811 [Chelonia mydas]
MTERGCDRDTLQCRVKVKELRNAYHKAREANRCSSAAPTSCWFYKELDVILGGNPTSMAKATVDTSVACVPVESGPSQEILDEDVVGEGDPEAEDNSKTEEAEHAVHKLLKDGAKCERKHKDFWDAKQCFTGHWDRNQDAL